MHKNKIPGRDEITIEHLINAHPCAISILSKLFKLMIMHEYIPSSFCCSISFPIPKEKGMHPSSNSIEYRGISVNPLLSKLFKYCLLDKFKNYQKSSEQQFGFKPGIGCNHEIYAMTNTVKYYTDRQSNVHICALDLSKAFDKVEHSLLFEKLMKRNCPRRLINILMNWYSQSTTIVKWGRKYSSPVSLTSGV